MLMLVSVFYHPHALGLALRIPRTASPEVLAYDIVVDGFDHCVSAVSLVQKCPSPSHYTLREELELALRTPRTASPEVLAYRI